jgi:hypothetical protein
VDVEHTAVDSCVNARSVLLDEFVIHANRPTGTCVRQIRTVARVSVTHYRMRLLKNIASSINYVERWTRGHRDVKKTIITSLCKSRDSSVSTKIARVVEQFVILLPASVTLKE